MPDDLAARVPVWEEEAEGLERRARALRQMVDAVRVLNGDATELLLGPTNGDHAANSGPVGQDALRRIITDHPGIWKVSDLKTEARKRGYPISPGGMEKAVRRLVENGEAERVGFGRYRFGSEREEEAGATGISGAAMIALTR